MNSYSHSLSVSPMVKIELEAAEALTALADSVTRRVDSNAQKSFPIVLDLDDQDKESRIDGHYMKMCDFMSEKIKVEKCGDLKRNSRCLSNSCKSRQNLTEAEKQSRKLRRVLANRESARQTIRRRQAYYEELLKKAADLAVENENLKREKEKAVKEYDSSKSRNEILKAQMSELVKSDEIREAEEAKANDVHVHNSSSGSTTTCPVFIYSQPFNSQFLWPSMIQPSNAVQPAENPNSYFIFQFPFLFPLPCNDSGSHAQNSTLSCKRRQEEDSVSIQHFGTSSREENCGADLTLKVQTEVSNSVLELENRHQQEYGRLVKPRFSMAGDSSRLPEKYPAFCRRKTMDSVAAAEARRKRKEVTRLKHLHLRLST